VSSSLPLGEWATAVNSWPGYWNSFTHFALDVEDAKPPVPSDDRKLSRRRVNAAEAGQAFVGRFVNCSGTQRLHEDQACKTSPK